MGSHSKRISGHIPLRHRARRYTDRVFAGVEFDSITEHCLKRESYFLIDFVLRHAPVRKLRLLGDPFAKTSESLSRAIPTVYTGELRAELTWLTATVLLFASEANFFIREKREFDAAMLTGDYQRASLIRDNITARLGRSVWDIEVHFLLEQCRGGFECNRKLLEAYLNDDQNQWVQFLANSYSEKAESELSPANYDAACADFTAPPDATPDTQRFRAYLQYRLNFHRFDELTHLPAISNIEESHSLIDRYLTLVRLFQIALGCRLCSSEADVADAMRLCGPYLIFASFRSRSGRVMDLLVIDNKPSATRARRTA